MSDFVTKPQNGQTPHLVARRLRLSATATIRKPTTKTQQLFRTSDIFLFQNPPIPISVYPSPE